MLSDTFQKVKTNADHEWGTPAGIQPKTHFPRHLPRVSFCCPKSLLRSRTAGFKRIRIIDEFCGAKPRLPPPFSLLYSLAHISRLLSQNSDLVPPCLLGIRSRLLRRMANDGFHPLNESDVSTLKQHRKLPMTPTDRPEENGGGGGGGSATTAMGELGALQEPDLLSTLLPDSLLRGVQKSPDQVRATRSTWWLAL